MTAHNYSNYNIKTWKKWILFTVTGVLLVFSLIRNSAFHYEFQTGKEWMSDDIITPFDFPVYKTSDELSADRSKILTAYKPYFQYDALVEQQQISAFSTYFEDNIGNKYNSQKNILLNLLSDVYQRRILQKSDIPQVFTNRKQLVISVMKNNISQDYPIDEILSPEDAYSYIYIESLKKSSSSMRMYIFSKINIRS